MQYISYYDSPIGKILIATDDTGIIGLWFINQKYFASTLNPSHQEQETTLIIQTKKWLDIYFSGNEPSFSLPIHLIGTAFQQDVWQELLKIPYGETSTYGMISSAIAKKRCLKSMSSQAVGGAIGKNPISIIVPCHRVISSTNHLTGYAGGIPRKKYLLEQEKVTVDIL